MLGADSAAVQDVFAPLTAAWRIQGVNVVGVVGEPHDLQGRTCGAGILARHCFRCTPPIYRETAPAYTSCHIDEKGVERAAAAVVEQVLAADPIVLSKFGKLESMGLGLATVFDRAIAAGKSLLTSVADKHHAAWLSFAPDARPVMLDEAAINAWLASFLG